MKTIRTSQFANKGRWVITWNAGTGYNDAGLQMGLAQRQVDNAFRDNPKFSEGSVMEIGGKKVVVGHDEYGRPIIQAIWQE